MNKINISGRLRTLLVEKNVAFEDYGDPIELGIIVEGFESDFHLGLNSSSILQVLNSGFNIHYIGHSTISIEYLAHPYLDERVISVYGETSIFFDLLREELEEDVFEEFFGDLFKTEDAPIETEAINEVSAPSIPAIADTPSEQPSEDDTCVIIYMVPGSIMEFRTAEERSLSFRQAIGSYGAKHKINPGVFNVFLNNIKVADAHKHGVSKTLDSKLSQINGGEIMLKA